MQLIVKNRVSYYDIELKNITPFRSTLLGCSPTGTKRSDYKRRMFQFGK